MSNINLTNIPKAPGIYKYFNSKWDIIYIWKSVNLFSRVSSYFNGKTKLNFAKKKMVENIVNIETIVVENETESLILETNLIKEYKPKYNILMKDDKNYMYIKISNEEFPKLIKTRQSPSNLSVVRWKKNWTYFGPYISTTHVNNILKVIKQHFWYGCYDIHFFKEWSGYNLDKYLFKNNIKQKNNWITSHDIKIEYNSQIDNIKKFLKWDYKKVIESLKEKMLKHANNLQFEEAKKTKDLIESLESLDISQNIRDKVTWDYDVIHYIDKFDHIYIGLIEIREWKILWYQTFEIKNILEETKEEVVKNFIESKYTQHLENNEKISFILPFQIDNILEDIIIEYPQIWPKKDILQMSYKNVYEHAYKKYLDSLSTKWFTKSTMQSLLKLLSFKEINKKLLFECNDISHFSWTHTVASRSIIENWKSNTSKYKKFNIKTLEEWKVDDFWSMKEVMLRRVAEIKKTWIIPDLIIIDGWKWQLSSVVKIVQEEIKKLNTENISDEDKVYLVNLQNLQLVWIAKREEELFLAWESEPIVLSHDSLELRLVQKIRDEAHRFAITFNRDKRVKEVRKNILESLPGFWPITRKKILNKYWNIEKLSQEKKENLEKILNKNQIEILIDHGIIWE